jgi:hypothetical protein
MLKARIFEDDLPWFQPLAEWKPPVIRFDPAKVVQAIVFHVAQELPGATIDPISVHATLRRLERDRLVIEVRRSNWGALNDSERLTSLLAASDTAVWFEKRGTARLSLKPLDD